MKPLFTQEEFETAKSKELLLVECYQCAKPFEAKKCYVQLALDKFVDPKNGRDYSNGCKYCSNSCRYISQETAQELNCTNCNTPFFKKPAEIKKTTNHFCSQSCSATYNNKNKKHGTRRSKLEGWIEEQLTAMFPSLEMHFNQSEAIGSELDIYIPSLNVAFEINGIFHYEPIYGVDKLERIQENDQSKTKACHDAKIDLCVIDTSSHTYVKPKTSQKYLDIIVKIIKERMPH